tara:strand:- start:314 stop:1675 length:1362 start_codon:yes stop_codon:yes gene_type:complete
MALAAASPSTSAPASASASASASVTIKPPSEPPPPRTRLGYFRTALQLLILDNPYFALLHMFLPAAVFTAQQHDANAETRLFFFSLLAIVPLADRLGCVTEQLAARTNEVVAGLLNASFGNVPELIVTAVAVSHASEDLAMQAIVGGVLNALLLAAGTSIFVGGLRHKEQRFNQANSSVLLSLVLLVAVFIALITTAEQAEQPPSDGALLSASRVLAVLSLVTYCAYLVFSLGSHRELFARDEEADGAEEEPPLLSVGAAVLWMTALCLLIALLTDMMVPAIEGASKHSGVPSLIITAVILPTVNNAAEIFVSVRMAWSGLIDTSIASSVGSAAQLSMLLIPVCILSDWAAGGSIGLGVDPVLAATLGAGALFGGMVLSRGSATWMHGLLLLACYGSIVTAFGLTRVADDAEDAADRELSLHWHRRSPWAVFRAPPGQVSTRLRTTALVQGGV